MSGWRVRILFVPRDLWVGVFIKPRYREGGVLVRTWFVCVLPMLPIRIEHFVVEVTR